MNVRHVAVGAAISLLLGVALSVLSIETVPSEPPGNLPEGMTPIAPNVGRTTTPVGFYMIIAGITVLVGSGIYSLIGSLKGKTRGRGK